MYKILFSALAMFIVISSVFAQKAETIQVTGNEYPEFMAKTQYKYPEYNRAKIAFKNGEIASARINYNNLLNVMKYIGPSGEVLEIANPDDISYLAVGADTIFYDNAYYDWIASSSIAKLAVRHDYKVTDVSLVGAFGTSSPAKSVIPVTKILGTGSYELSYNQVLTLSKETTYYISLEKGLKNNFVVANKKNIKNLFPKKDVDNFIKENKINLNKEEDLVDLLIYVSKNNNQDPL